MMTLFVGGVIAGLAIAVPVGPIGVLLVDRALRQGFAIAAVAGLGAATADFLYAALAVTVGTAVAALIEPALTPLRVAAVAALLWIALRNFRGAFATADVTDAPKVKPGRVYATFLGLTVLNPATMIYFASLIVGLDLAGESEPAKALFVLGAFVGSAGWQTLLAGGGAIAGAKMGDRVRTVTSVLGSLVIVGLAIQMATRI